MRKKVVIVGAGFGGIYTYLNIQNYQNDSDLDVVLIAKNNYFLFTPLLHEVATGGLNPHNVVQPVRNIVSLESLFIEAEVKKIDLASKKIFLDKGEVDYDFLVLATGAKTNFYTTNITNSKVHELKDLADACKIRNDIIENFEQASKETDDKERTARLTFVVVGAGATGVELFTEIHDYIFKALCPRYSLSIDKEEIKLYLVNKSEKILERFDSRVGEYASKSIEDLYNAEIFNGCDIEKIADNQIFLNSDNKGKCIFSKNIYWAAGVRPVLPQIEGGAAYLPSGRLQVTKNLNLENHPEVFAIGDCAGDYPLLAQVAVNQSETVSKNILALAKGSQLADFDFKVKGMLVSLGYKNAAAHMCGFVFHGFFAWFIWRTIYLFKFISWGRRIKIAADWTVGLLSSRDISKV